MISLSKILVLIGILAVVWFGFRLLGKVQRQRQEALRRNGGTPRSQKPGRPPVSDAQEMVKCPGCGVYVASDAGRCGTPGCPH